jgi:transcription antitermination factor NusG
MEQKWFAVYTKPRWEKKVAETLSKRNIENYCPLNMVVRQWSDRKKTVYEPLLTSYVFVRVEEKQHSELKQMSGVINLVYWLKTPAVIKDKEIDAMKEFLDTYKSITLEKTAVDINDTVRILTGPLMEYEGNVISINKNKTVRITLPSLGFLMVAEVQKSNVEVVAKNHSYHLPQETLQRHLAFRL